MSDASALPEAVTQAASLPSLPLVAVEVLELVSDPETTLDELARCVARDPALAARLMSFANSAMYNLGSEVTTLQRAALVLGMKSVQLMALSFSLAGTLPRKGDAGGFDYEGYWRRSLVRAVAARSLAAVACPMAEEEAFLCGLLAEIGQLTLAQTVPDSYSEVLAEAGDLWPSAEQEHALLGYDHLQVAEHLLERWSLPELIRTTLRHSFAPPAASGELPSPEDDLVKVVGVAHSVVDLLTGKDAGAAFERIKTQTELAFGLKPREVRSYLTALDDSIREVSEMLELPVLPGASIEELLAAATSERDRVQTRSDEEDETTPGTAHRRRLSEDRTLRDRTTDLPGPKAVGKFLLAETELRRTGAEDVPVGLLILEPDALAAGNLGERAARELLMRTAGVIRRLVRRRDFVGRLDERTIAVVLPQGRPVSLRVLAERLRRGLEAFSREQSSISCCTIGGASLGSATESEDWMVLLSTCRQALEAARKAGGNQVSISPTVLAA